MDKKKINAESLSLWIFLRSILGALLLAAIHFVLGLGLHSWELGLFLALWVLVLGPLLLPGLLWFWQRHQMKAIRVLHFGQEPELLRECYHGLLYEPGPHPQIWSWSEKSGALLWVEVFGLGGTHQKILLSETWLKDPAKEKVAEWKLLWSEMARQTPARRKFRTLQMAMWVGAFSPLSAVVGFYSFLFIKLGFRGLPPLHFLLMRFVWDVKILWLGAEGSDFRLPERVKLKNFHLPPQLSSILWGPWSRIASSRIHPAWSPLFHKEALLQS